MSGAAGWRGALRAAATEGPLLDRIVLACMLLLPVMLLHGRGIADILLTVTGLLFLLRSARGGGWGWLRRPWVALALVFWLWMVFCTLLAGSNAKSLAQAVVSVRLLLLVAACEEWALRPARTRLWLARMCAVCLAWVGLEVWQQYLTGRNLGGYRRMETGQLTGPFQKPRAGGAFVDLFFPALLPPVMRWAADKRLARRVGGLLLLLLAVATMLLIGQRMPAILMLFGLVVAGLLVRGLRWPVAGAIIAFALVVALLPVLSPPTFERMVLHFMEQMRHFWISDYGQIYTRALEMVRAEPWFGLGYDGFRNNCSEWRFIHGSDWVGVADSQISIESGCNIHPHNYWFEVATSFGVPGALMFSALAVVWIVRMLAALRRRPDPIHTAVCVAAIVMLWPIAARSSLFVVDAGGWAFFIAGWGLAFARAQEAAGDG